MLLPFRPFGSRSEIRVMMTRVIFMQMLVSFACAPASFASEPVSIGVILENPQAYHLHIVTLQGTARHVRTILEGPYFSGPGIVCYGAYTFDLEDATGSIEVVVRGVCGKGQEGVPQVSDGDRVQIEAHVQAPGHYGGEGLPILGEDRTTTQAIATKVWRVAN
jgi:hypothetical protein